MTLGELNLNSSYKSNASRENSRKGKSKGKYMLNESDDER
jgi:hypothetical protein